MKLASIFTDGAVLQRRITIPVWGTAEPLTLVHAVLNGKESWTRAADDGKFMLRLPAMEAGGPFELTVENADKGKIVLHDILIGEVWIAGGQSNMEYTLSSDWAAVEIPAEERGNLLSRQQEREFYKTLKNPERFRFISVPKIAPGFTMAGFAKMDGFNPKWRYMTPEFAKDCTAVGAWFGKKIGEELDVPVGIIADNWGGTIAETWTSRSGLLRNPRTAAMIELIDQQRMERDFWPDTSVFGTVSGVDFHELTEMDSGNQGFGKGWAAPEFDDSGWKKMEIPGDWVQQEISGNGSAWFRKTVDIPESWAGKDLVLSTGGIDKHDISYFNGVEVGRSGKDFEEQFWCAPRMYTIPGNLVHAGKNVIAIRAYSFCFNAGFNGYPERYCLILKGTDEKIAIAGTWQAWPEKDLGIINPLSTQGAQGPGNPNTYGTLYKSMLCPVAPYAIRGAIWYQGESNADNTENSIDYYNTLKIMIEDWRSLWGQGDFPFLQVQLAGYNGTAELDHRPCDNWALLREAQFNLSRTMKNVGMISAIDIGMNNDIHPWDKKSVGMRLADNALHNVYHRADVVPNGPVYVSARREGNAMRIYFEDAAGLFFKDGEAKGFFVAGPTRFFKKADSVRIEGSTVLVSCSEIDIPAAVRYSWANDPNGNLYNAAGQPSTSFRTDDWPI